MPWTAKTAIENVRLNGATVTLEQYAERVKTCEACERRKTKMCPKTGRSVAVDCKYPSFACPIGQFPSLASQRKKPSAVIPKTCTAKNDRVLYDKTSIPEGERKTYACDVVIPFYNGVKWLPQAIDSILCQRYVDVQIHIVDDQSPEDSTAVREEYEQFDNVHWHKNPENIGPYASVHRVWSQMTTPYFAVHDADDVAFPNRLWRAIHALETTGREIYGAAMEQFLEPTTEPSDLNRQYVTRCPVHKSGVVSNYSPLGNVVNCTMVIRRDTFERLNGFAGEFNCSCDQEFITRAHYAGATFFIDSEIIALRRVHTTSLSRGGKFRLNGHERKKMLVEWDRRFELYRYADEGFDFAAYGNLDGSHQSQPLEKQAKFRRYTELKTIVDGELYQCDKTYAQYIFEHTDKYRDSGIKLAICPAYNVRVIYPADVGAVILDIDDFSSPDLSIWRLVSAAHEAHGRKTVVHCNGGQNRSSAAAIAILCLCYGKTIDEALKVVRRPSKELLESVRLSVE